MKALKYIISSCAVLLFLAVAGFLIILHIATNSKNVHKYLNLAGDGDVVAIKKILDDGISPNLSNSDGISLLDFAVGLNQIEIVKLLLDRGATVDIRTDWGETPFMNASGGSKLEIAKLLLARGANPKALDNVGKNALMQASQAWDGKGCTVEALDFLLSLGLDINAIDNYGGNTALMWAAYARNTTALKWLIEKKADINRINRKNTTALDFAISNKHTESIEILKKAGAKTSAELEKEKKQVESLDIMKPQVKVEDKGK